MGIDDSVYKIRKLLYQFAKNRNMALQHSKECNGAIRVHDMMVLKTINQINNSEPVQMSVLAKHFKVSAPAISQISRKLEKLGYIERVVKEDDRRSVYVTLTEKAKEEMKESEEVMNKTLCGLIEFLGEKDSDDMIRILEKVDNYFSNK